MWVTEGKTFQRKAVHAQDVTLQNTHSLFLFKKFREVIGYWCIKTISIIFRNQTKISPKTPILPRCHSHPLASKDLYSQLNIKLLVFQYKAKPQHIMLKQWAESLFSALERLENVVACHFKLFPRKTVVMLSIRSILFHNFFLSYNC